MPDISLRLAARANSAQAAWLMAKVLGHHPTQMTGIVQDDAGFSVQVTTPDTEHLLEFLRSIVEILDAHAESPSVIQVVMRDQSS